MPRAFYPPRLTARFILQTAASASGYSGLRTATESADIDHKTHCQNNNDQLLQSDFPFHKIRLSVIQDPLVIMSVGMSLIPRPTFRLIYYNIYLS